VTVEDLEEALEREVLDNEDLIEENSYLAAYNLEAYNLEVMIERQPHQTTLFKSIDSIFEINHITKTITLKLEN
jgi:hypothetical protein